MLIRSIKINKKIIILGIIIIFLLASIILFYSFANETSDNKQEKKDFIKWVDFDVNSNLLSTTAKLDIDSHYIYSEIKYNWIELLSYLA